MTFNERDRDLAAPPVDGDLRALIRMAVREDVGGGDETVRVSIPEAMRGEAIIVARKAGVISGLFLMDGILEEYRRVGASGLAVRCETLVSDGTKVEAGAQIATLRGSMCEILSAERVVLNFLGHLSGVATMTRRYVEEVAAACGEKAPAISDTRKTTPGYRVLDKYAVRCGGGVNLRMGLFDGVMLKDNHLAALRAEGAGKESLAELTRRVKGQVDAGILVWLEVDTLEQLREELAGGGGGADIVLLDNFSVEQMREAVAMRNTLGSKVLLEASGGITLVNVAAVAKTGVDRISIGALTHSAPVLDLAMDMG